MYILHTRSRLKANLCLQLIYANNKFHLTDDPLFSKPTCRISKRKLFLMAFYRGLIIPTGHTIGSSVVPHHILPEPTKDHASLPAGRLNYFMPYRNILFCTLSFMSEVHRPICQIYYIQGLLKSKSQCNRKLVATSHKSWATVGGASFVPSLVALPWIKPPMDFNKIGISKGLVI